MLQSTEKLLLECVRANSEKELTDTLEPFLENTDRVDWLMVAETIPHIYLKAKNARGSNIPLKKQKEIDLFLMNLIKRNELFKHEIKNLANEFKKAKIDLIFLKGAAIFTTVYGDYDLRIMGDIDVLIRKDTLFQAEGILMKMGYKTKETEKERKTFLREHFHYNYFKKNSIVELHWDIGEQWHWDMVSSKKHHTNIMFNSAKKIRLNNTMIQILSPAHSVFVSCFHFERDLFLQHYKIISTPRIYLSKYKHEKKLFMSQSLRFFYEIKKMLEYYGDKMNWDDLFYLVKETEKEYEIFTLLFLSEKVAISGVPKHVIEKFKKNLFVRVYILLSCWIPYASLDHLLVLNRAVYRFMLIFSYIKNRKFYLLGMRIWGGRI